MQQNNTHVESLLAASGISALKMFRDFHLACKWAGGGSIILLKKTNGRQKAEMKIK